MKILKDMSDEELSELERSLREEALERERIRENLLREARSKKNIKFLSDCIVNPSILSHLPHSDPNCPGVWGEPYSRGTLTYDYISDCPRCTLDIAIQDYIRDSKRRDHHNPEDLPKDPLKGAITFSLSLQIEG